MTLPFVIDNQRHRLADVLNELLAATAGKPVDVATAYFNVAGYRLLRQGLHQVGAFRLLIGAEPASGTDVGLRARMTTDLAAEPFTEETLRLVEELIAFLRADKVLVRLYDRGFLHAKAYLFHQDVVDEQNRGDRMRPFAAIVGSSNFTGPGLTSNRELNLVHRVLLPGEAAVDAEAARSVEYMAEADPLTPGPSPAAGRGEIGAMLSREGRGEKSEMPSPAAGRGEELEMRAREGRGEDAASQNLAAAPSPPAPLPHGERGEAVIRQIKSEVGARAVTDLTAWFERQWADSVDFKEELIDLLDASKFGGREYTPYQVYIKALYEYFREELGADPLAIGRSAVDLAEFQEDAVRKARRILARYDGVLIADSVGLGKTWIGKKLLEDFAYHRRQRAVVVCPASLREMWRRELASATIAATVIGMEELGREGFDTARIGDADVLLLDESHNFRNSKSNRYLALDEAIQRHGGRGRDGERKKLILLSATPINNDLYDLANQIQLFTQGEADYFRDAGIGDVNVYFRRARRLTQADDTPPGLVLFNLLEEIMVRNTRPFIQAAYPNATINGKPVVFPDRRLHTVEYDLGAAYGDLYKRIVVEIERLSLAPYQLETYRKKSAITDEERHKFEQGREEGLVGIFKTRFLKRLESSVFAFRESLRRALVFEETYLDYLLDGTVVSSRDFQKLMRYLARDEEDDPAAGSLAEDLDAVVEARTYLDSLPKVDLNQFRLRDLRHDVEEDIALMKELYARTEPLVAADGKLAKLRELLAGPLRGQKVLIFSTFKDTSRYVHRQLTTNPLTPSPSPTGGEGRTWPHIRRIDSGNHPDERGHILGLFAPVASGAAGVPASAGGPPAEAGTPTIDILISTDVLSEGQNLQDCGVLINYDLTWNPIRLVQRNGRIDRIGSPHARIGIYNMFPEEELEGLLHLVERLTERIARIDDLGLLDASVLGEVVHPRTFNTLRRIRAEDGAVLDEEEARAELAGPEVLLQQLKEVLHREAGESVADLPNGIHSGLRRQHRHGMFFYFQAPRTTGEGRRHFWRYIDARGHAIKDNRFEIAQTIACQPDEPRYIGDQDVFALQERVIEHILASERDVEAKAAAPTTVDPIQQTVAEELKDALRRQTVDRELAKACIRFLGQPMGRSLHVKLKRAHEGWTQDRDDSAFVAAIGLLADEFGKERPTGEIAGGLRREDLELICFEYVTE